MKRIKREYTHSEQQIILQYIIDNEGFYSLRGNLFWKKMEKDKILDRTWQSMKEHFRMKIIHNLMSYKISKENQKKIIAGFNNTKIVEKKNNRMTVVPKHSDNVVDFTDEEKETEKSTSSDDSLDFVFELDKNLPSTSSNGSKKTFKRRFVAKPISSTNKSIGDKNTSPIKEQTEGVNNKKFKKKKFVFPVSSSEQSNDSEETITIVIDATSPLIPDANSDKSTSTNVSLTDIDEAITESSIVDDKKFLQAITKYQSNLLSCASVELFIKQYTGYHDIRQEWTELYDRFIEILNNLQLYDFLAPEIVTKLQNLKEPLINYRSNGFQEPKTDTLAIKVDKRTFTFVACPDPKVKHVESFDFLFCLEKIKTSILEIFEDTCTGKISEETATDVIKSLTTYNEKYALQRINNNTTTTTINDDDDDCVIIDNVQIVKEEIIDETLIKQENLSLFMDEDEVVSENATIKQESISNEQINQSVASDSISIQPDITVNLSDIQCDTIETSQYLESLTTQELNVTNIIGQMIENDLNQSDLDFFTCPSNL